jgi:hypothetical protein
MAQQPKWTKASSLSKILDHIQLDTAHSVGLVWTSDRPSQRPLPDKTQHLQETDIHAKAGFEPTIPASERPQTYTLDRALTGIV